MEVIFTEGTLTDPAALSGPLTHPASYLANPKAVAAQTFKAKNVELPFHESKVWADLGRFFTNQFAVTDEGRPTIELPSTARDWIVYPFSIVDAKRGQGCVVWLEDDIVRHLRLYSDRKVAEADNAAIRMLIEGALGHQRPKTA